MRAERSGPPRVVSAVRCLAQLVSLLTPTLALAEPKLFVELDYRTEPALRGCPSEAVFRRLVEQQLGFDPFRVGAEQKLVARALRSEGELLGYARWYDASGAERGERQLRSARNNCGALVRELGFAVVVQIQLLAEAAREKESSLAEGPPASGVPLAPVVAERKSSAPPPAPPSPSTPKRSMSWREAVGTLPVTAIATRWQISAGLGSALSVSFLPQPALQGRGFAALRRNWLGLELGADTQLPLRFSDDGDARGFESSVTRLSVAGCGFAGRFVACLASYWGRLGVRGVGVEVPRSSSGLFAQLGVRLGLAQNLTQSWVGSLRAEALVSLAPWSVTLNEREVWRTPRFGATLGLDLAAVFYDKP